ncbi:MAG: hypothetical protein ACT4PM_05630 [Gemmatimonadales bacterium]
MIEPRRLALLMAALGGFLVLHRVLDLWATPGLDLATAPGRARVLSAILSRPAAPLVADLLLVGAVVIAGRARSQRALGGVHVAGGILLILAIPVFWFASVHLAESIGSRQFASFRLLVIRGLILLAGLAALALAAGRVLLGMARRGPSAEVEPIANS